MTSAEHIAKRRILALHQMAQLNCIKTGGDPAEAVMDLLVAACAIAAQQRPRNGVAPDGEIDHINGIRHDNRIANLREADRQGNCRNRAAVAGSTSKHIGVSWNSKMMMWRAQISVDGKNTHLGYFVSEADAAAAYRTAAKSHYGEFHRHEIGEVNAPANH